MTVHNLFQSRSPPCWSYAPTANCVTVICPRTLPRPGSVLTNAPIALTAWKRCYTMSARPAAALLPAPDTAPARVAGRQNAWPALSPGQHHPQTQPVLGGRDCRPFRPDPGSAPGSAVSPPGTETPPGNRGASLRVTPLSTASGQWPDVPSMSKLPARSLWPFQSGV